MPAPAAIKLPSPTRLTALEAKERAQWIAFAPFVFQATRALRDSGILAALETASTAGLSQAQVVEQVGLPDYGVRVLLEAALGIGLVEETAGRYRTTRTVHYLLHDALTRTNMDFAQDVCYEGLAKLPEAVRDGRPAGLAVFGKWPTIYQALAQLPEKVRRSWFAFDHLFSDSAFPDALPLVLRHKPRRLLDIGGNTGKWAEFCLRADPDIQVGIVDLPGQLRDAERRLREAGVADRVSFHEADLLQDGSPLPQGYDSIWMSQFLDCFSEAQIVSILRRCRQAMSPGTLVFILEPFWDRQRYPLASFCLQMTSLYFTALANGTSQMYRSTTFLRCVEEAGFDVREQHDNQGWSHTLLVCCARA
jgi:ubiquinone/menaquinone biosynthesis C-methylase UbiE